MAAAALLVLALPAVAVSYNPGVSVGQYVKYGNFVSSGPGFESFGKWGWLQYQAIKVSGQEVTLLSTGEYKNGTALPGNGTTYVWDVATGTENGVPSTEGPIIAANLDQGNAIPPPHTFVVNATEERTFLGVSRSVNFVNATISTPDYNSTLNYVYDRASGMLLESNSKTTVQAQPNPITSTYSYSVIETNIFGSSIPEFPVQSLFLVLGLTTILVIAGAIMTSKKKMPKTV